MKGCVDTVRDDSIDFIKGVAIILMVACHAGVTGVAKHFVYLFHVSMFLLASGYFLNPEELSSIKGLVNFTLKRVRRLWFPFILWTGIFTLCHNPFIALYLDSGNMWNFGEYAKALCYVPFMWSMPTVCCAMWFVGVLFCVSLIYAFVSCVGKHCHANVFWLQCVIAVCFLVFGNQIENNIILMKIGGPRIFVCYALLHLGVVTKKVFIRWADVLGRHGGITLVVSFVGLLALMLVESVELENNRYNNGLALAACAVFGWLLLRSLFQVLDGHALLRWLTDGVSWVGKHTMPILIFHFMVFKMVTYSGIVLGCGPLAVLSKFPTAFHDWYWVVLYTVVGVALPVVMSSGWFATVDRIRSKRVKSV